MVVPIVLTMIILCKFCPNLFVAIAFDSGGAAAGSLTASFVLPFMVGICSSLGIDVLSFAFGTVGIIAMLPTIVVQIMGVRFNYIVNKNKRKSKKVITDIKIIDFE